MHRSLESRYSPVILQLTGISGSLFLAFSEPKKRDEKGARSLLRHSQIAEVTRSGIAQWRAHVRGDMRASQRDTLRARAREGTLHFSARCTLLAGVEATGTSTTSFRNRNEVK